MPSSSVKPHSLNEFLFLNTPNFLFTRFPSHLTRAPRHTLAFARIIDHCERYSQSLISQLASQLARDLWLLLHMHEIRMSQQERPGSSQSSSSQQRMPFQAAEALLWGRKTHNEHVHLYSRMRELEEQHRDYDTRIQAAEVIAEAADAATARVRRVEQQVAAIESDEQDRPFDKWVQGEVSTFKTFIEGNKSVRQKQVELEGRLSRIEDSVDKTRDTPLDFELLLERIARLERDHISDANRIRKLETDVTILTLRPSKWALDDHRSTAQTTRQQSQKQMLLPPSRQPEALILDDSETEDENINAATPVSNMQDRLDKVQVPRSPELMAQ